MAARHPADTSPAATSPDDRRGDEERTQRTMRFTPVIDRKLRDLAEARGIDLNAAVCVAVSEDWMRVLGVAARHANV